MISEAQIADALASAPLSGWPRDEEELASLFNRILNGMLIDEDCHRPIAVNG
ncbi:hypothetical protein V474_07580 [Novosphingobium barchaimii LL02]|uniref:Uncharacterized protein n=1 Tax=Novosphingobium barchaimii LL02 TaxID=1114963 RepID=A0A0J8B0N3_9SPHN|nr:hypothetical protein [Novosphingobium barchaimii]KMS59960.1 hypothetical protein V474_07580 [Novosphingobium barchaimii LL02]